MRVADPRVVELVGGARRIFMHACETRWSGRTMEDSEHVAEWKQGLPTTEELTPLSQSLISPVLACAFSIKHEASRTPADVQIASRTSFHNLRSKQKNTLPSFDAFPPFQERKDAGSYGYAGEGRGERGDSRGEGRGGEGQRGEKRAEGQRDDGRGEGIASYGDEGRVDVRAGGGDIGLGVGNGGSGGGSGAAGGGGVEGRQGAAAAFPQQAHAGHVMPPVYAAGSEGNSYNSGDGRQEQGSLPFMLNLPYGAYERRSESSYGRGDDSSKGGSAKNARKTFESELEDTDSAGGPVNSNEEPNARTLKRPRLVWTPQLHKRFVDAVGHLGIKNAVPKTIMQLMNVEGLTRENVASHLQKYRLYLKRMQGLSNEGPSASDQLFGSTPLPANLGGLHYMGSQRDDVIGPAFTSPAAVPMPFQGLGSVPLGPTHFGGYDIPFGGMGRGIMQQQPPLMKERTDHVLETENHVHLSHSHSHSHHNHNQPNSPTQRTLSLFPTTSD